MIRLMVRRVVWRVFGAFVAIAVSAAITLAASCTAPRTAEDAFRAEETACVTSAKSREEADSCRAEVRARWGLRVRDGGGDA